MLEVGDGIHRLIGGAGGDIFRFDSADNGAIIEDFQDGTDRLDFSSFLGIRGPEDVTATQEGQNLRVFGETVFGDIDILMLDFSLSEFDSSDFFRNFD